MPSDFANRRNRPQHKTLADLLAQLDKGRPTRAKSPFSTSPVAGPGRMRNQDPARTNRQSALERRQQAAREALKRLRGE